jgi:hypothetical protein
VQFCFLIGCCSSATQWAVTQTNLPSSSGGSPRLPAISWQTLASSVRISITTHSMLHWIARSPRVAHSAGRLDNAVRVTLAMPPGRAPYRNEDVADEKRQQRPNHEANVQGQRDGNPKKAGARLLASA